MLISQRYGHHGGGGGIVGSAEVERGLDAGRPLDRGLGQRQVDFMQGDGEAAIGVDGVGEGGTFRTLWDGPPLFPPALGWQGNLRDGSWFDADRGSGDRPG